MHAKANGLSIGYSLEGRIGAPVVMLSHGLALDRTMWSPQVAELGERYTLLRYDLRGHGTSEKSVTTLAISQQADDAASLLKALDIPRVHFVGLSMGGMIGQVLAIRYPSVLATLTLVDTASEVPAENKPAWEQRIQAAVTVGMDGLVEPTMERWFTSPFRARRPDVVDWARELVRSAKVECYVAGAQAIAEFNVTAELANVHVPTLVVVGDGDQTTPVHSSQLIHQLIEGSQLEVLSPAAHLSNVEQFDAFNTVTMRFLQEHGSNADDRSVGG
jgi:3-oxoadipate enol-lactonase